MTCAIAGKLLPTADDRIDVERIDLQAIAAPARAFGSDQRGATAQKAVQHDPTAVASVHNRIGYHRDRLYGWMQRKQVSFVAGLRKGARATVVPHIAPIAPMNPEHHVVAMRSTAVLEHKHKLVLAAVK